MSTASSVDAVKPSKSAKKRAARKKKKTSTSPSSLSLSDLARFIRRDNVLATAAPGVYFAVPASFCDGSIAYPEWCFGMHAMEDDDEPDDEVPDMAIDPDDGMLTLLNSSDSIRTYFLTIENCAHVLSATGANLMEKPVGIQSSIQSTSSLDSKFFERITFNAIVMSRCALQLCILSPPVSKSSSRKARQQALSAVSVSSDIQDYVAPAVDLQIDNSFELEVFPLAGSEPFLCTQSSGGALTHFCHPSTYHAIDLRCPVGTSVLAVCDGEIVEVKADSRVTGIHCQNLFHWNSIVLQASDAQSGQLTLVEYVHISADGVCVKVGDRVSKGQVICQSGQAGFCPEPHLHLEVKRCRDVEAPSVPLKRNGQLFVAGQTYC
jgi:hypothetical protein